MKKFNYKHFVRQSHRYLGLFIGIQFLFWTIGGLYFSWTNIKEIRGEHLRQNREFIDRKGNFVSPQTIFERAAQDGAFELKKLQLVEILGAPFYELTIRQNDQTKIILADALTGAPRGSVTETEAARIASTALVTPAAVGKIVYLTRENVGGHHEYREKPLPAWAVTFDTPENLTIYLSAETGQIGSFRTDKWRVFDFLWMLHTMDYDQRDDFNNFLLRAFSVLGIATILSGFVLFFVSSKFFRGIARRLLKKPAKGA